MRLQLTCRRQAKLIRGRPTEGHEAGHRLVVRNGHHQARDVSTAAGAVSCGRRGQWQDDDETFNKRPLKDTDYVYSGSTGSLWRKS